MIHAAVRPFADRAPLPGSLGAALRAQRLRAIAAGAFLAPGAAFPIDRYAATIGNVAANDFAVPGTRCLTLQHAINHALAAVE